MGVADPSLQAIISLGDYLDEQLNLRNERERELKEGGLADPDKADPAFAKMLSEAHIQNAWFTPEQVLHALEVWTQYLNEASLTNWLSAYPDRSGQPITVALITAGNVPLVGFHDLLCVLLTGNRALVRCASKDRVLLPFLCEKMTEFEPGLADRIRFTRDTLKGYDAVIATGSNNTSRYFQHYFGSKPHIIRKNRHSVAVLTGEEGPSELRGLAEDIMRYFGMGCRSVSKLFVPEGYEFKGLFEALYGFKEVINHQKYANNYDYNKAVYLMSGAPMLDNGFLLLKEDSGLGSPIGTLFYESYPEWEYLLPRLSSQAGQLQCVVGPGTLRGSIPYGTSQDPGLSDYADGVDTLEFLLKTPFK